MRKMSVIVVVLALGFAVNAFAGSKQYGKGVTVQETTKISQLLESPEKYLDKKVKVQGMITEVCAARGCWIYLASDRPYEKIQVKVLDGEIVFPMSASGRMAVVEGVVQELQMSREELVEWRRHQAAERGQEFDPASVKAGEKIIRLVGIGAMIEEE